MDEEEIIEENDQQNSQSSGNFDAAESLQKIQNASPELAALLTEAGFTNDLTS